MCTHKEALRYSLVSHVLVLSGRGGLEQRRNPSLVVAIIGYPKEVGCGRLSGPSSRQNAGVLCLKRGWYVVVAMEAWISTCVN